MGETTADPLAASGPDDTTFTKQARATNITWKETTATLPDEARLPGDYEQWPSLPFCLPQPLAEYNLLPDARAVAQSRFDAAGIRWHGDTGAPSNHLLSSQVQCLNALAPFVGQPDDLAQVFSAVLPIAEVLPFGAPSNGMEHVSRFESDDHVVFEWQGLSDHLHEWPSSGRIRGAYATSADAAFRYRSIGGAIELALVEWKYTERYPDGTLHGGEAKNAIRCERYRAIFEDPGGPIDSDLVALDDLLGEPVYQLARLAMLGHEMARTGELGAERVRVVYAAPERNGALWASHGTPRVHQIAVAYDGRLDTAWGHLLRDPGTFTVLDTGCLVQSSAPTSEEFRCRYGHLGG